MTIFKVGDQEVELLNGDRICNSVAEGKPFEPQSLQAWAGMMDAGNVALDIGAYTGLYAIAAAKFGARAVAMEPMPGLRDRLERNARRNGVKVEIIPAAASSEDGEADIVHNPKIAYSAGASLVRKKGYRLRVKTMRVDSLNLENVCAIKIDVEKHEAAVLRGARNTLERWRPKLLVEALDDDLKAAVLKELPDYELAGVLDVRNLYLEPR